MKLHSHLDDYEPRQARTMRVAPHPPRILADEKPSISPQLLPQLRYVKQQSHTEVAFRVTEKWMSAEAKEAFELAAHYAGSLVMGEAQPALTEFVPARDPSFYVAMAIGVRHAMQPDQLASGVE